MYFPRRRITVMWPARAIRLLAVVLAVVLPAGMLQVPAAPACAAPVAAGPSVADNREPVRADTVRVIPRVPSGAAKAKPANVTWPGAGTGELAAAGGTVRIGGMTIRSKAASGGEPLRGTRAQSPGRSRLRLEVLSREQANAAGVRGLLVRVRPAAGSQDGSPVRLIFDYAGFAGAFGGDYGARLQATLLPDCVITQRSSIGCGAAQGLASRNDTAARTVSVDLSSVQGDGSLLALDATDSSSQGNYEATPFSPSSKWGMSPGLGSFNWSYPMRTPPVPGGLAPTVSLAYSSQFVDGHTAATNNQGSWVGEGFSFEPGYIERRYRPCREDGHKESNDLCWAWNNASIVLNGQSSDLVRDGDTGAWRLKKDDGSRVEALADSGNNNGDNNGEYWRVTTGDGTEYYFGMNRLPGWSTSKEETASTWTAPVFGDDADVDGDTDEPCYKSTFADAWCRQAWRWNLDYVKDPHGNVMSYFYQRETNYYARLGKTDVNGTSYHRGGYLKRIDYGQRHGQVYAALAPAQVVLDTEERCLPTESVKCKPDELKDDTAVYWPDVPWDRNCATDAKCKAQQSAPTFWTRRRLAAITTRTRTSTTGYQDVESWRFTHIFTDNGDASRSLWLQGITHVGLVGDTKTLPSVDLDPIQLENRVDDPNDNITRLIRPRLSTIYTDSGGQITVNYYPTECAAGALPQPGKSTKRCFPVRWEPPGWEEPITDWFHKYVVKEVKEIDRTGGADAMVTRYEYLDQPAWHYDEPDGVTDAKYRTWGDWRGYGKVRVRGGDGQTMTTRTDLLYLRGMHGDKDPDGGTRSVTISDSTGTSYTDHDQFAGLQLESASYNGDTIVSKMVTEPWSSTTATDVHTWGTLRAQAARTSTTRGYVSLAAGGWRRMQSTETFDAKAGRVTRAEDLGDLSTAADDRCTRTTYADNAGKWLRTYPSTVETVAVACDKTPDRATQVISDQRTFYDGSTTLGEAPTAGNATRSDQLSKHDDTTATYTTVSTTTYDEYGRALSVKDAEGGETTTAYTQTNGLVTRIDTTNPMKHASWNEYQPAWGQPIVQVDANGKQAELAYDPLGRLASVWLPDRRTSQTPSIKYTYKIRKDAATALIKERITNDGGYRAEYQLFDGLLRERQTQVPGSSGGRLVTDTVHNAIGQIDHRNDTYYAAGVPSDDILDDNEIRTGDVNGQTYYEYDGAGRITAEVFKVAGDERWRTTNTYGGDRVHVDPPAGAVPTTTVSDVRGNTTELLQYHGSAPNGDYDRTSYTYTSSGQLATVTDPAGIVWRHEYDQRDREIKTINPDTGTSEYRYDDVGRLEWQKSGNGKRLFTTYDLAGRKTGVYEGDDATGTKLAAWVYDAAYKGQLSYSQRLVGNAAYTTSYPLRDEFYRPKLTRYTIPASEGKLAKTYEFTGTYNADGTVQGTGMPQSGDLQAESLTYTYDNLQRPIKLSGGLGSYITGTLYDQTGKLTELQLTSGGPQTWVNFAYERGTKRLKTARVQTRKNGVDTQQVNAAYNYDDAGNILSIADTPSAGPRDVQCFRYDYLRRLTEAWATGADSEQACASTPTSQTTFDGPAPYWQSYTYDLSGNRLTETLHGLNQTAETQRNYRYPTDKTAQPHTVTSIETTNSGVTNTAAYHYDSSGNTTGRPGIAGSQTLVWDAEGNLAEAREGSNRTTFIYDADGNRLLRKEPGATTLYLPGTELRLNTTTSTVTGTRYYDLGGNTTATRTAKGVAFLVGDHQGTAQTAVDAATGVVTKRRFTPFGTVRGQQPTIEIWPSEKGFVGGTTDTTTGLTHLGAREYDPSIGRFISADPVTDYTDPQQINGYTYSNNNPVTFFDPTGLDYDMEVQATMSMAWKGGSHAKGNTPDHDMAVYLRVANLRRQYPRAHIDFDYKSRNHGADIVCWDCKPGEVWVWEIKSKGQEAAAAKQVDEEVAKLKINYQVREAGLDVKPGPLGAFKPPVEYAVSPESNKEILQVHSEEEGVEIYEVKRTDEKASEGARNAREELLDIADDEDERSQSEDYLGGLVPLDAGVAQSDPLADAIVIGGSSIAAVVGIRLVGGAIAGYAGRKIAGGVLKKTTPRVKDLGRQSDHDLAR